MGTHETVKVYNYRLLDTTPELSVLSSYKAPREIVARKFRGEVLEGTGEEVPVAELDALGRYRRIASGWGELA